MNNPKEFMEKLREDPVKLKKFMRAVIGPSNRTLEGKEQQQVLLLLAMTEPYEESNNQHSWTECYRIGQTEYRVTTFPGGDVIVDQMLPEDNDEV